MLYPLSYGRVETLYERTSAASEPRERSEAAQRRARERVGGPGATPPEE